MIIPCWSLGFVVSAFVLVLSSKDMRLCAGSAFVFGF